MGGRFMRVTAIGQFTDDTLFLEQINKQTIKVWDVIKYIDKNPIPDLDDLDTLRERRRRISSNHSKLKEFVEMQCKTDFVWQLESDSVVEPDCLERLINLYQKLEDKNIGYVSGIQMGRHGLKCVGAWRFKQDGSFRSLNVNAKGIQTVDGSGFYCLLAKRDVWLKGEASWNGEPYGPDVAFGLSLRKLGYNIYMDMANWIGHKTEKTILWPNSGVNVEFYQSGDKWKYKVI